MYPAILINDLCMINTLDQSKTDDSFKRIPDTKMYSQDINLFDKKLTSLYDLKLSVQYDAGLANTPDVWEIQIDKDTIKNNQIKLFYYHGNLDGWLNWKDDKADGDSKVCYKYVDSNDIQQCYVQFIYQKKNGQVFTQGSIVVNAKISVDELKKLEAYYLNL